MDFLETVRSVVGGKRGRKKTEPAPTFEFRHTPVQVRAQHKLLYPGIRRGMWVILDGRPGIADASPTPGIIEVHVTDSRGDTLLIVTVPVDKLRQAKISEIPEPRRNVDNYLRLGYEP